MADPVQPRLIHRYLEPHGTIKGIVPFGLWYPLPIPALLVVSDRLTVNKVVGIIKGTVNTGLSPEFYAYPHIL